MAIFGATSDKALGAGAASGATSGLSIGGPVGAVVGAFVGAAAGLFAGTSAQQRQNAIDTHNKSRQGTTMMLNLSYRQPVVTAPPPKQGSLGYLLNQTSAVVNQMAAPLTPVASQSDPNLSYDNQGNAYYYGVKLVPDTSKHILPDGSIIAHEDFPDESIQTNLGKLLNSLGYGVTIGPIFDKGNNTDLSGTPYVYSTPAGTKLTAAAIKCMYSLGMSISDLSPAAMLAAGVSQKSAQTQAPTNGNLQAGFKIPFGLNPIMAVLIVVLIVIITYKYS